MNTRTAVDGQKTFTNIFELQSTSFYLQGDEYLNIEQV